MKKRKKLNLISIYENDDNLQADELTKGINIKGLQEKYKKNLENAQFSTKDLEKFDEENRAQIKNDLANFNVLVDDNENEEEFMKEKYQDYEKDLPQIQPKKAGNQIIIKLILSMKIFIFQSYFYLYNTQNKI
ncbi:hypothetical protein PPERSA_06749 [Pseudocohnilembus persalinus]|uniref:Uncharacterized protein n=1 Tax=Pseudocohnilembus persalinus TaxID=266149 RepID=A0A0V0QS80_PSEPJ|nr:hypothetical protein PPERSA_06749 [Pseudocohnilembus persalinus]|eukprot:KRX05115.1 hypothetical protein PPERSA_06749 [Pseudocohnilembus persalinus]